MFKNISKEIKKAESLRLKTNSQCHEILVILIEKFDFEIDSEYDNKLTFFHVEYQASDGFVLGDNDSNVYALSYIINHINKKGNITSLDELKRFSI